MYTKIDELLWKDRDFKDLKIEDRLLFIYLLSCPHRNVLGLYSLPKAYICADLKYPLERVSKGLCILSEKGFISYDDASETVFVTNFLKYNPLENQNQVKGAAKKLDSIPKTDLLYNLLDRLEINNLKNAKNMKKAVENHLEKNGYKRVMEGLPQPIPKQEEEKEEEKEKEKETVSEEERVASDAADDDFNIYSFFEQQFGRTLRKAECDMINYFENNHPHELIKEAVSRGVLNQAANIPYIKSILEAWKDKGITTIQEVYQEDAKFQKGKKYKKSKQPSRSNNKSDGKVPAYYDIYKDREARSDG